MLRILNSPPPPKTEISDKFTFRKKHTNYTMNEWKIDLSIWTRQIKINICGKVKTNGRKQNMYYILNLSIDTYTQTYINNNNTFLMDGVPVSNPCWIPTLHVFWRNLLDFLPPQPNTVINKHL